MSRGNIITQTEDVFSRLRMGIEDLPSQQKQICAYLLENYQKAAFYTVEELAKESKTSPATVVRVVKRLGYGSYKELIEKFQAIVTSTNSSVWWELEQVIDDKNECINEPTLSWVSRDTVDGIKNSLTRQLMDSFDNAVDLILNAKKIGIVGMRSSRCVAEFLHFMLNQLAHNAFLLGATGADVVYDDLLNMKNEDVLVAVSLGGPHFVMLTQEILASAKDMGIPSVLITNEMSNPAINNATVTLCVGRTKYHYSIAQALVLSEALTTEFALKRKSSAKKKLKQLEDILVAKEITMP